MDTATAKPKSSWRDIPAGVWVLGFVSLLMDISSEMIHALLPVYLVVVLGTSMVTVGLIEGIAEAQAELPADGEALPVPRTRATRINFPNGRVHMVSGPRSGTTIALDRVVAAFGKPGHRSAVLVRRPHGYFLAHVEGRRAPRVNGQPAGKEARRVNDGDVIEVADEKFQFAVD